jgi:hypothetical protein
MLLLRYHGRLYCAAMLRYHVRGTRSQGYQISVEDTDAAAMPVITGAVVGLRNDAHRNGSDLNLCHAACAMRAGVFLTGELEAVTLGMQIRFCLTPGLRQYLLFH